MAVDNLSNYSGSGGIFARSANPAIQQIFNNMHNSNRSGNKMSVGNSSGRYSGPLVDGN